MISTSIVIWFVITFKPFASPLQNFKETLNEALTAMAAYPLLLYSDWLYSDATRRYASWWLFGILCTVIIFNMCCLLATEIHMVLQRCKNWCTRRRAKAV